LPLETSSSASLIEPSPTNFKLEEASILELQEAMNKRAITSKKLVELYLLRMAEIDRAGPSLNSVIEINPDAFEIADRLDKERLDKGARGKLHGIPILLKDNIATEDKMQTTAGSLALLGSRPKREAFVATKLREAGAIILGKANLSEWANFRSTSSSSGWSARGGQVKNPYALNRSPCGSSSGSAVAVSANLASAAIGTETDGSILCPSSMNCVVGIKPTLGLVSRDGVVPIAHSQDTVGPIARTVTDAAILLGALVGVDRNDPVTKESKGKFHEDYTQFLDPRGLKDARIGIPREVYFGYSSKTDEIAEIAISKMRKLGAKIIDPANIPSAKEMQSSESELTVLLYEFKHDLNRYLSKKKLEASQVRTLKELIEYNEIHKDEELKHFGQELFLKAQKTKTLKDPNYLRALKRNHALSRKKGIDAVMTKHRLDALVMPSASPPWVIDLINGDHFVGSSSQPAALAGYPAITVPAGFASGLPVGITFMGRAYSEPKLIKLAYAFEQATRERIPPKFTPIV
jgi:amidase